MATALIAAIVPATLMLLMVAAQRESATYAGSRTIAYPQAMRWFIWLSWCCAVPLTLLAGFAGQHASLTGAVLVVVAGLFAVLLLPLHLETFFVAIAWDDTHIYTRSPWRWRRTIPFTAITSCDFSPSMQWYRIRTKGYGIIRLHLFVRGIPDLLTALPCATPPYPPSALQHRETVREGDETASSTSWGRFPSSVPRPLPSARTAAGVSPSRPRKPASFA